MTSSNRVLAEISALNWFDFYLGKQYMYATKLVQFKDVYLPVFAVGEPENAGNLRILLWIRNDRSPAFERKMLR